MNLGDAVSRLIEDRATMCAFKRDSGDMYSLYKLEIDLNAIKVSMKRFTVGADGAVSEKTSQVYHDITEIANLDWADMDEPLIVESLILPLSTGKTVHCLTKGNKAYSLKYDEDRNRVYDLYEASLPPLKELEWARWFIEWE